LSSSLLISTKLLTSVICTPTLNPPVFNLHMLTASSRTFEPIGSIVNTLHTKIN
jgi:hypothetical protein